MDRYIDDRSNVISPATVREYRRMRTNDFAELENKQVCDISDTTVQRYINRRSSELAPKTIKNIYMFLLGVVHSVDKSIVYNIKLPQKNKYTPYSPTESDIIALLKAAKGKKIEIPILLAAFGSLRRSEICALTVGDIRDGGVYINKAMVRSDNKQWVIKYAKTTDSERFATLPYDVVELIRSRCGSDTSTRICGYMPNSVYNAFRRLAKKHGIPHFRLHDLRHYWVSVAHAMGMPDFYLMQNGGWTTMDTPRKIYMYDMSELVKPQENAVLDRFAKQFKLADS